MVGLVVLVCAEDGPTISGDVWIHSSADIHPTAKLGPNVSIGIGAKIGPGARIRDSIILDRVVVGNHSLVMNSIVDDGCTIGEWSRVEVQTVTSSHPLEYTSPTVGCENFFLCADLPRDHCPHPHSRPNRCRVLLWDPTQMTQPRPCSPRSCSLRRAPSSQVPPSSVTTPPLPSFDFSPQCHLTPGI